MIAIAVIRKNTPEGTLTFGRSAAFFAIWIREVRFSRTGCGAGCRVTAARGTAVTPAGSRVSGDGPAAGLPEVPA